MGQYTSRRILTLSPIIPASSEDEPRCELNTTYSLKEDSLRIPLPAPPPNPRLMARAYRVEHSVSQDFKVIRLVFTMKKLRLGLRFGSCHKFRWPELGKVHVTAGPISYTQMQTSELCPSLNTILQEELSIGMPMDTCMHTHLGIKLKYKCSRIACHKNIKTSKLFFQHTVKSRRLKNLPGSGLPWSITFQVSAWYKG